MFKTKNKTPIIDWEHQAKTETENPLALAKELLSMFVEQLPALQTEIEIAFKQKNPEKLHTVLHRFQGACAYCGLVRLRDTINASMETLKSTNQVKSKLISPIKKQITIVLKELKKIGVIPKKK